MKCWDSHSSVIYCLPGADNQVIFHQARAVLTGALSDKMQSFDFASWCKNKVWLKQTEVSLQMKGAWKESLRWKDSALSLLLCRSVLWAAPAETASQNASLQWFGLAILPFLWNYFHIRHLTRGTQSHECFLSLTNEIWAVKTQK